MLYEVSIIYKGTSTYFVEAADEDTAAEIARKKFRNGERDECAVSHDEDIMNIEVDEA